MGPPWSDRASFPFILTFWVPVPSILAFWTFIFFHFGLLGFYIPSFRPFGLRKKVHPAVAIKGVWHGATEVKKQKRYFIMLWVLLGGWVIANVKSTLGEGAILQTPMNTKPKTL